MSSAQFPLGSSRNTFIQSDPPGNTLVQLDPQAGSKKGNNRPRSLSSPLGSTIILSAVLPTFSISNTEQDPPKKTIKARRNSEKSTDKKIINLKRDTNPEIGKKITPINLKRDGETRQPHRRRDSKQGNDSHSPRRDIYGKAKTVFTKLEKAAPGTYLLLRLGKKIDNHLPVVKNKINVAKKLSAELANEMEQFIDNVLNHPIYNHYINAIKIVESGLKEETTENLFSKLKKNESAYDYEIYAQIILQRALNELQLNSTSPRHLKKTTFLTHLCKNLKILSKDYADKFPLGFHELFRNFHEEAKIQLAACSSRKPEQPIMISDQRTAMNSSTEAITYMFSICEGEAMRAHIKEANKLLDDLEKKAIPGNFLRIKIGKEIDRNIAIFNKWVSESLHSLPNNELVEMKAFYNSISKNDAYATYLTETYLNLFGQERRLHNNQTDAEIGKILTNPREKHQNDQTIERLEEILVELKEKIKNTKRKSELCNDLNPNDNSKKEDNLQKLSKYYGLLEITMEALLEQAIKECKVLSKAKLPKTDISSNFLTRIKYNTDNFSKYIYKFPEGYIDLFNQFRRAITELEHFQQTPNDFTISDNTTFSIKAINLQLKIFEEDILHLQQEDTAWVLENLPLFDYLLKELYTRKSIEERLAREDKKTTEQKKEEGATGLQIPYLPSPENNKKLLLMINEKLEKAKKFLRLQQIRRDILNLIKDSKWTQEYLFNSDDPLLHNLREQVLPHADTLAPEVCTSRSRSRKRFSSREDLSSLEKSSSPRVLEKSTSPSPRLNKTLTRSTSSASIERIKTPNSTESKRLPGSLSDSTNSDSPRTLSRTKSCKVHSSSPRKISSSPRIENPIEILKKNHEAINNEYLNLLITPGTDIYLQRYLIATHATFFKPMTDDPILVELLKGLRKKFLEEGPYEKQAVLIVLREILYNPVIALIHFQEMKPWILEIIDEAKCKCPSLHTFIGIVEKRISSLDSDLKKLGAPKFYTLEDYSSKFAVEHTDLSNYENNINVYSQSLKRLNLFDYIQIGPLEFKTANISFTQSPHICALGDRFSRLSDWVLESIFLKGQKNEAARICQMIEFFIDMMDSLLDNVSKTPFNDSLRKAVTPDYLSAQAIFVALQKSFVENLFLKSVKKKKLDINIRHTNENVAKPKINISEKHLKKYLTFKEILTNNANFKELRSKIKEDLHCIPPVHLTNTDITHAFEQNPITDDNKINLRCVESLGNLLLDMAKHQKHLIPMYLPFGKQSSLFENLTINFDQVFQVMISNEKYHDDKDLFDSDILDTLCRNKVKEIFPKKEANTAPAKEENTAPKKQEKKARFET